MKMFYRKLHVHFTQRMLAKSTTKGDNHWKAIALSLLENSFILYVVVFIQLSLFCRRTFCRLRSLSFRVLERTLCYLGLSCPFSSGEPTLKNQA